MGGANVDIADYPFLVRLESSSCAGALIAEKVFITAGHCSFFYPRLGAVNTDSSLKLSRNNIYGGNTEDLGPYELYVQPTYFREAQTTGNKKYAGGDLAIIKFAQMPMSFQDMQPLPIVNGPLEEGESVEYVGWGFKSDSLMSEEEVSQYESDSQSDPDFERRLKATSSKIKEIKTWYALTEDFNDEGKSTRCHRGDSGGPVLKKVDGRHFFAGVLSHRSSLGGECRFTLVDAVGEWIRNVLSGSIEPLAIANPALSVGHMRIAGDFAIKLAERFEHSQQQYGTDLHCSEKLNLFEGTIVEPPQCIVGTSSSETEITEFEQDFWHELKAVLPSVSVQGAVETYDLEVKLRCNTPASDPNSTICATIKKSAFTAFEDEGISIEELL